MHTVTHIHSLTSCSSSEAVGVRGLAQGHVSGGNEAAFTLSPPRFILPVRGLSSVLQPLGHNCPTKYILHLTTVYYIRLILTIVHFKNRCQCCSAFITTNCSFQTRRRLSAGFKHNRRIFRHRINQKPQDWFIFWKLRVYGADMWAFAVSWQLAVPALSDGTAC